MTGFRSKMLSRNKLVVDSLIDDNYPANIIAFGRIPNEGYESNKVELLLTQELHTNGFSLVQSH
ncbi:MAG: hypothetical protein OHK0012_19470 [Synechococcales cyanobacterium]